MPTFWKLIRKFKEKEQIFKLLMLGLDNSGKTSVVKSLFNEDVSDVEPTLGFRIRQWHYREKSFNVWDVGGQRSIQTFWRNYFGESDALIWVIDSSDESRLKECIKILKTLLQEERLSGSPCLILANKMDLVDSGRLKYIEEALELESVAMGGGSRACGLFSISALTREGVREAFDWLVDIMGGGMVDDPTH
eukprot:GHVH01009034.1.p3 GENE.GHVH01009034.1~~GHVH01009034.1.p3  ORF type:complete len:192 (-),score=35.99 GHVH01009034.1:2704-3279(-)